MKRSDFLKRLGIGLGAVVVAPKVLVSMPAKEKNLYPTGTMSVKDMEETRRMIKQTHPLPYSYPYHKGDIFVRNGHRYVLISRGFAKDGEAILKLRPLTFTPNPDVNVLVSNLGSFRHTKESCLLKFND